MILLAAGSSDDRDLPHPDLLLPPGPVDRVPVDRRLQSFDDKSLPRASDGLRLCTQSCDDLISVCPSLRTAFDRIKMFNYVCLSIDGFPVEPVVPRLHIDWGPGERLTDELPSPAVPMPRASTSRSNANDVSRKVLKGAV